MISGTLEELGDIVGCSAGSLMKAFDDKVNQFFTRNYSGKLSTARPARAI